MLWRRKRGRIDDKAAMLQELRHGQRHQPKHSAPPNGLDPIIEIFANEIDHAIFAQLADFAAVANDYLDWSRWALEQLADTELHDDHPSYGRRMRLYYNRVDVGEVDIQPGFGARIEKTLRAECSVSLAEARHLPYADVMGLLTSLGHLIVDQTSEADAVMRIEAKDAMMRYMWSVMVDPEFPGTLEFQTEGGFAFYHVRHRKLQRSA